jgi:SnoaL-like domain
VNVTAEASRETMSRYFADLDDGDAARHLTDDVVWVNEETGERITGPAAVIDFVRALHDRMGDLRTRHYVVGEDAAFIEGDCMPFAAADGSVGEQPPERLPYVVAYDLTPGGIAAMRLYMSITRLPVNA